MEDCHQLGNPDLIILPGTKNTLEDLLTIYRKGLGELILQLHRQGTVIFGICGGYQMLGQQIQDPYGVESSQGKVTGLGLLNVITVLQPEKITEQVTGTITSDHGLLTGMKGIALEGYEIHMGTTEPGNECVSFVQTTKPGLDSGGVCNTLGNVLGTYIHGIFDNGEFTLRFINNLRQLKNLAPLSEQEQNIQEFKEEQYDILADTIRNNVDIQRIYSIMNSWKE